MGFANGRNQLKSRPAQIPIVGWQFRHTLLKLKRISKMQKNILEQLNSLSLYDFTNGVNTVVEKYQKETDSVNIDQEIMEKVLSIFAYERFYQKHSEWNKILTEVMKVLPKHTYLLENFLDKYTFRGLSLFVNEIISGEINISGFMMAMGSPYLVSSTESKNIAASIKDKNEDDSLVLLHFADILEHIYGTQVSAKTFIVDFKEWNKETCIATRNILLESNRNIRCEILFCLATHKEVKAISEFIIQPYENALSQLKQKYIETNNLEKINSIIELENDLKENFING